MLKRNLLSILIVCFIAFCFDSLSFAKEFLFTSNVEDGTIRAINLNNNQIAITSTPIAKSYRMAVNLSGTSLYAPNRYSYSLYVIDTTTLQVIATVPVGYDPIAVAISPSGDRGYVASYDGSVTVFDTGSNNVVATIPLSSINADIIVNNDGSFVYVSNNTNAVYVIDTVTNQVIHTIANLYYPFGLSINPSGTRLYITQLFANTLVLNIPNYSTIDIIDTHSASDSPVYGPYPTTVTEIPSGDKLYINNHGGANVSVVDVSTNIVTNTIYTENNPWELVFNSTATRAYVVNSYSSVSIIDTATDQVIGTIPFIGEWRGLAYANVPDPNHPPILNPVGDKAGNEGQLLKFQITATDPDQNDILTFSADNIPAGATLDPDTAIFSWTPAYNQAGNYVNVEITVTDNGNPIELDTELITITIGNVNRAPVFTPVGPQTVNEGELLEFAVLATDPDGDSIVLKAINIPSGVTFDEATSLFTWRPDYLQEGTYTAIFTATDDGDPIEYSEMGVLITVGNTPNPTQLTDDLIDDIENSGLPRNVVNSYLANLKKVNTFIDKGKIESATNQIFAFMCKVEEDLAQSKVNQATADDFFVRATKIVSDLGRDPASRVCE